MTITVKKLKNNTLYSNKTNGEYLVLIGLLDKIKEGVYEENGGRVGCKDYIGDSIAYQRLGYKSGGSNPTLTIKDDSFCFYFITYDKKVTDTLIRQSRILNNLEKKVGIPETKFYVESDNYVVIDADKFWIQSTLTTSTLIQIVRSLIYPTLRRRVLTHFKACLSKYKNEKDTAYWNTILNSEISLEFLLSNIKDIINGNPWTSCNDKYVLPLVGKKDRRDNPLLEYDYLDIPTKNIKGEDVPIRYYRGCNHGSHGIVNLCNNIIRLKAVNNDWNRLQGNVELSNFETWAINYQILKEGL